MLQRDYWAVVDRPRTGPRGIGRTIARHFERFAPPGLVRFQRMAEGGDALRIGDVLEVEIPPAGSFGVRVVHRDPLSLTLVTLEGHPEAGRITFGTYPNREGDVVLHVRSRARSGRLRFVPGFLTAGEPMQTATWSGWIDRLAAVVGEGVRDVIHVETREVEETAEDRASTDVPPTYRAENRRNEEG